MNASEWMTLGFQTLANVIVISAAVSRLHARLAVIETKIKYIERELNMMARDTMH